ncbi:MAG TPA: FtsQ-type POTRA domain-containing protein [Candidatus Limnocylindrales bacterium]
MNRPLLPRNSTSHVRRTRVRRTTPRLRGAQMAALIFMCACLTGIFVVGVAPSFATKKLEIHGATFTSEAKIRSIVGIDVSPNAFRIETDRAAAELVKLPAVLTASVVVQLPSTVVVTLVERVPRLIWAIGDNRYVVDQDGQIFGLVDSAGNPIPSSAGPMASPSSSAGASQTTTPSDTPRTSPRSSPTPSPTPKPTPTPQKTPTPKPGTKTPTATAKSTGSPGPTYDASLLPSLAAAPTSDPAAISGPMALGLAVVFDRRSSDAGLGLGGIVDPVNLDAGYRLANLTPTDVGSTAGSLAVVLDDTHGFTLSAVPNGWVGQFGFFAPTVRQVSAIPTLVRDLRSTLAQWGEAKVAWVILVSDVSSNHSDTVILR